MSPSLEEFPFFEEIGQLRGLLRIAAFELHVLDMGLRRENPLHLRGRSVQAVVLRIRVVEILDEETFQQVRVCIPMLGGEENRT